MSGASRLRELVGAELGPSSWVEVVNDGADRVRFPAGVPSGNRVRGPFRVVSVDDTPSGKRAAIEATVECDEVEKPVCVAELLVLTPT